MGDRHTTLSIESTCDDTSIAVVTYQDGYFHVHRMLTYTQTIHEKFSGAVPEYASRSHAERLPKLVKNIAIIEHDGKTYIDLSKAGDIEDGVREYVAEDLFAYGEIEKSNLLLIDSITVASHPGLPGSVVSGVTVAHFLSHWYSLPLYEVDHIMGHVFSVLLDRDMGVVELPYLCVTASGGHSDIYIVDKERGSVVFERGDVETGLRHKRGHTPLGHFVQVGPYVAKKVIQTMDDAIGEAFDKVSVMLGGPYPGGLWISQRAELGGENPFVDEHIRPIQVGEQFSFSGIKAQVKKLLDTFTKQNKEVNEQFVNDISKRFQDIATDAVLKKLEEMVEIYQPKTIGVVGGVSANAMLREKVEKLLGSDGTLLLPASMRYCVDNAAMIAVPGLLSAEF